MFPKNAQSWPSAILLAFLMVSSSFAEASVIYEFVGVGEPSEPVAFQLAEPAFLTPPLNGSFVDVACAQLDTSTNCNTTLSTSIHFVDTTTSPAGYNIDVRFDASNGTEYDFYFATGALGTFGTYTADSQFNPGTLIVTAPEPTAITMVGCGSLLIFFMARAKGWPAVTRRWPSQWKTRQNASSWRLKPNALTRKPGLHIAAM
jgi:hypothetical protein